MSYELRAGFLRFPLLLNLICTLHTSKLAEFRPQLAAFGSAELVDNLLQALDLGGIVPRTAHATRLGS